MSLSPLDISKHEFSRAVRGYDSAEVRAFLERMADELSALQSQASALIESSRINEAKLEAYHALEKDLRDSLLNAQESTRSSREQLELERQNILREAQISADEMRFRVEKEIVMVREELRALKLHRDGFVKRLRFLLKSQNDLIELIENESPDLPDDRSSQT